MLVTLTVSTIHFVCPSHREAWLWTTRTHSSRHVRVEDVCRCHVGGERVTAGKSAWFARAGKSITPSFCTTAAPPLESGHLANEERPVAVRSVH